MRKIIFKSFILIVFCLSFNFEANAQGAWDRAGDTRTALPERIFKNRKKWGVDLGLSYTEYSGNANQLSGSTQVSAFRAFEKLSYYLDGSLGYARSRGVVGQNRRHIVLRMDRKVSENFKWFAFNTHAYNQFLRLDYRTTVGAGPWYDFIGSKWKNGFSVAPTYYYEEFQRQRPNSEGGWSFRNYFTYDISETASGGFDLFYAPRMKEIADFHFYFQPFLTAKVYKDLVSLRLSYTLEYDSRPIANVRQGDRTYMTTFNFAVGE
jgi:hypothetical protein